MLIKLKWMWELLEQIQSESEHNRKVWSKSGFQFSQVHVCDYGTLRPGDIEASDIEATTLRPGDIEARRHWGQATLRPGDIEARRLWGQICMSNFPKPKHWPQSRDFEANVWPRSRDDVEARRRWGQICMGNYPKERMGCREHIYCTNVQKMQSLSKWKKITSRKW